MKRELQLRRLFEAAQRDGAVERFEADFGEALAKKEIRMGEFSIRRLFENFVPDGRQIVDLYNPGHGGSMAELKETSNVVASSQFAKISGQLLYNAVMQGYEQEQFVVSSLIPSISTQFNGERIPGIGGLGDAGLTVDEGMPYPRAGVAQTYIDTPATTKRGVIVEVTKEAIFFDRTGLLERRCSAVGEAIGIGKEKRAINCLIDENSTDHRYRWRDVTIATYGDNSGSHSWDNLAASNALVDWTDIDAAEQLFSEILDPETGEPILISPSHVFVTRQLLYTAKRVINATDIAVQTPGFATTGNPTETRVANPVENYTIVSTAQLARQMATDTTWYLGDPRKAFAYMENWPLTVVQAPANSEAEFTSDVVMRFKASERGAYATMDPRYMVKCTA
jgi:hypothetical protein